MSRSPSGLTDPSDENTSNNKIAGTATDCTIIFAFPVHDAEKSTPIPSITPRIEVTSNSRPKITTAIHGKTPVDCRPSSADQNCGPAITTNAPSTSNLSANGSMTRPNTLTAFHRRARYPSAASVNAATTKSTASPSATYI